MTNDGYKSCRKLREKVLSTELNIRYRNTKYSSLFLTAPVAEWLAYFPYDSYIAGSSRFGRIFIFRKISWLKGHWNVPAIQSTEWWLTEIRLSRHHSAIIQSQFSRLKGEISSCVYWRCGPNCDTPYLPGVFNVKNCFNILFLSFNE